MRYHLLSFVFALTACLLPAALAAETDDSPDKSDRPIRFALTSFAGVGMSTNIYAHGGTSLTGGLEASVSKKGVGVFSAKYEGHGLPYCCSYSRIALTYGRALRWRWGHIGGGAGPQVNWWRDYDGPGVGLHISGEAYFTPLRWLGIGLEPSVTLTHQRAHFGVLLLGLKFGRLAPASPD